MSPVPALWSLTTCGKVVRMRLKYACWTWRADVLVHAGRPYLIDWGQARYGSFYLDLPNYFTPDSVHSYRDALAELGLDIPEDAFMRRYREAGRYPGFKYVGVLLHRWVAGRRGSLHGP